MSASAQEFAPGVVLDDRYTVVRQIGSGGMGAVYAAERIALGDLVAIKQLHAMADTAENRSRLLIEARAAAHIRHPNVVKVFDFGGVARGAPYLVMEYIEGTDLEILLERTPKLSVRRALELFGPICAAIEAGHRRGVIHRDLKPSNVLIATSDDGRELVKVADFGLAVLATGSGTYQRGELLGTPQYMAPETIRGEPPSPATDIFALGVLLYQMLTGRLPFVGKSPHLVLMATAQGEHRPANEVAPDLPPALVSVLDRTLHPLPDQRPASPEQLARQAERAVASTPVRALQTPVSPPTAPLSGALQRRHPDLDVFIGRREERTRLHDAYQRALGGEGHWVTVVGEPGIGKTRLVERFVDEVGGQGRPVVLWGRFYDDQDRLRPAYEVFHSMLEEPPGTAPMGSRVAPTPTRPLGAPRPPLVLEAEGDVWRLHAAFADAFAALAGSRPLVLVLDDLQWARRTDLDLLDHLHRTLARRGTLMVATIRPQGDGHEVHRWQRRLASQRAVLELELTPWAEDETRLLLDRALGSLHIHPSDLRRLHRASSGNPYFLAEIVRRLLTRGSLVFEDTWRCESLATLELPPTITQLVEARLGELDAPLRQLLEVAAVIGGRLDDALLTAASGLDDATLDTLIDTATTVGLLDDEPSLGGASTRFASETVRRVLYEQLSPRRRRRLHRQVVEALHQLHGDDLLPQAPALAHHSVAMGHWPEALRWGLEAAEQALEGFDSDAAEATLGIAHCSAEGLGGEVDAATHVRLDLLGGRLARRLGQLESAKTCLLRALDRSTPCDSLGEIQLELAHCQLALGELEAALASSRQVTLAGGSLASDCADTEPVSETSLALRAGLCEASVLARLGRFEEAAARLDTLLEGVGDRVSPGLRSRLLRERAWTDLKTGRFAAAEKRAQRSFELARSSGDLMAQHRAVSALAGIRAEAGDLAGALPWHQRALELARRLSLRRREGIDLANIGEAHFRLEAHAPALEHFEAALAIFVEIGDRACQGDCQVNIGRTQLAVGEVDQALSTVAAARKLCEATGRAEYVGIAWMTEGRAHLEEERIEPAKSAFENAHRLFGEQRSHLLWQAELGLARTARRANDLDTARRLAQSAADRLRAQRVALAHGVDATGIDRATASVRELLETLPEPSPLAPLTGRERGT